jgi:hypothetical protein
MELKKKIILIRSNNNLEWLIIQPADQINCKHKWNENQFLCIVKQIIHAYVLCILLPAIFSPALNP